MTLLKKHYPLPHVAIYLPTLAAEEGMELVFFTSRFVNLMICRGCHTGEFGLHFGLSS